MKMSKSLLTAAMITAAGFGLAAANVQVSAAEELPETSQTSVYEIDLPQEATEDQSKPISNDVEPHTEETKPDPEAAITDNDETNSGAVEEISPNGLENSTVADTALIEQEKDAEPGIEKAAEDKAESADETDSAEESEAQNTASVDTAASSVRQNGWVKDSYLQNGVAVTNKFLTIDNETYYFNAQGKRVTGQHLIDGSYYCFDLKNGSMKKGLTDLSEDYNSKRNGGAKTVYYDPTTGKMRYGQQYIDGGYYCFDLNSGAMKKGITYLSEAYNSPRNGGAKTVYYDLKNGRMRYGQQYIEGSYYCFDLNSGVMKKGITYLSEAYNSPKNGGAKTVYYDKNTGKMRYGQQYIDGGYYCFDLSSGAMKKGITYLSEAYNAPKNGGAKTVYYDKNSGKMRYGQQYIDGSYYCFDLSSGAMKKGFTYLSEAYNSPKNGGAKTVYYDKVSGKMQYGLQKIDGKQYCFDLKDGSRKTGITSLTKDYDAKNPRMVYFDDNGVMQTGVIKVENKTYVFEHNSGALKAGFLKLDESYGYKNGSVVYCDANGEMKFGEQKIGDHWYCFEHETGIMMTGLTELDSSYTKNPKVVLYDEQGRMLYGERMVNGKVYTFDDVTGALLKISQQRLKGIDISEHQGSINFSKVAKEVSFAILRSGYSTVTDKRFFEYVNGCKANGISIPAVYCFSYALNRAEAIAEAQYTMNLVQQAGLSKDTIIFYDFEYDSVRWGKDNGISLGKSDCIRFTDAFCNEVERYGYKSGVYANLDYYNRMYNPSSFKNRVFWYARYQEETEYDCVFHQYGSTGRVNGIKGNVDMNWWYL